MQKQQSWHTYIAKMRDWTMCNTWGLNLGEGELVDDPDLIMQKAPHELS